MSISRASLKWGIPLPNDPGHVVAVYQHPQCAVVPGDEIDPRLVANETDEPGGVHHVGEHHDAGYLGSTAIGRGALQPIEGRGRSETLEAPFVGRDEELRLL